MKVKLKLTPDQVKALLQHGHDVLEVPNKPDYATSGKREVRKYLKKVLTEQARGITKTTAASEKVKVRKVRMEMLSKMYPDPDKESGPRPQSTTGS